MGGVNPQSKIKIMDTNEMHIFTLSTQYFIILQTQKKKTTVKYISIKVYLQNKAISFQVEEKAIEV